MMVEAPAMRAPEWRSVPGDRIPRQPQSTLCHIRQNLGCRAAQPATLTQLQTIPRSTADALVKTGTTHSSKVTISSASPRCASSHTPACRPAYRRSAPDRSDPGGQETGTCRRARAGTDSTHRIVGCRIRKPDRPLARVEPRDLLLRNSHAAVALISAMRDMARKAGERRAEERFSAAGGRWEPGIGSPSTSVELE